MKYIAVALFIIGLSVMGFSESHALKKATIPPPTVAEKQIQECRNLDKEYKLHYSFYSRHDPDNFKKCHSEIFKSARQR